MIMTFTNEGTGVQGRVKALTRKGWYAVTLLDLESGEVLPYARHLQNIDEAIGLARLWAGLSESPETIPVSI